MSTYQEDVDAESAWIKFKLPPPFAAPWITLNREEEELHDKKTFGGLKRKSGKTLYLSFQEEENDLNRRRAAYATECRELEKQQLQGRYQALNDVVSFEMTMTSEGDQEAFPIALYRRPCVEPDFVTIYFHGGGLKIGEADSEAISCRLLAHHFDTVVYSVGYRLIFKYPAEKGLQDAKSAYNQVRHLHSNKKILIVGVSSGGTIAALLSQWVQNKQELLGVILRNPVTLYPDAPSLDISEDRKKFFKHMRGPFAVALRTRYVDELCYNFEIKEETDEKFLSAQLAILPGYLIQYDSLQRDGLARLPGEAGPASLKGLPPTLIQACTNDPLFGDSVDYARLLEKAGVEYTLSVWKGLPHAFFHGKGIVLDVAYEAEMDVIRGVRRIRTS